MTQPHCFTSTCRCCSHYSPQGRRGGNCQQLGVPVKGCWKACSLATHPFYHREDINTLENDIVHLEHSLRLTTNRPVSAVKS